MRDMEKGKKKKRKKSAMSQALHTISKLSIFTVWIPSSYRLHVESRLQAKLHLKLKTKSCVPTWSIKALRCWTSLQLQDASSFSWHWQMALVGASSLIKITLLAFSRLMHGVITTIVVSSPRKILQRCLWWCLKYINLYLCLTQYFYLGSEEERECFYNGAILEGL